MGIVAARGKNVKSAALELAMIAPMNTQEATRYPIPDTRYPIRVAILWHQHQPYYRAGNEFLMPWAWLHATKDYREMAEHFERHPKMRGTINLVPSLLKQLEEYLSGTVRDPVVELMSKPAEQLTAADKELMLDNFFYAHHERMIARSPRYHELFENAQGPNREQRFTLQDYRDLAVHYALAWTGELARQREPFKSLVQKERDFSEADKQQLATAQRENVRNIIPLHQKLATAGQIELTTSPFYHPILPLLIDTDSAREAMPHAELPRERFRAPHEAERQIERAKDYVTKQFGTSLAGMWPSEGSLSAAALSIIRKQGFTWTASDESVLAHSLGGETVPAGNAHIRPEHARFFPWRFETAHGEITVFFRDHGLSDDIGFTYQSWRAEDAVEHFVQNVLRIRSGLIAEYGEGILDRACVPIILDGENCWEYYPNNGLEFLDMLYSRLTAMPEIAPVTFSQLLAETKRENLPLLHRFVAGSWIHANFSIWIGHPEDNAAWDALHDAYTATVQARNTASLLKGDAQKAAFTRVETAEAELMIAEGSDWCWWYGEEHFSLQKDLFDELYRMHLREVYRALDRTVPEALSIPLFRQPGNGLPEKQFGAMQPASS